MVEGEISLCVNGRVDNVVIAESRGFALRKLLVMTQSLLDLVTAPEPGFRSSVMSLTFVLHMERVQREALL